MAETIKGGKSLYFDCYSGISGDMALGALLDLGLDLEELRNMLGSLELKGYCLKSEKVTRRGIAGTRVIVDLDNATPVERNLPAILKLIEISELPIQVIEDSSNIFKNLAQAEAKIHGVPVEKVHFHEVGAVDAIVDIVGTAAALYLLGVEKVFCSPLPLGRGEVKTAHGKLPLPAPATLELLAMRKVPVEGRDCDFELVTPTGAALVTTLASSFEHLPDITVEKVGYGAGTIDPGYPNYLRAIMGKIDNEMPLFEEKVAILETGIDDLSPEIYGYLMERLFDAGALDVYFSPIQMKKNRPAVHVTVLTEPSNISVVREILFRETSTLGLRLTSARKIMRPRELCKVQTQWGEVRVKYTPAADGEEVLDYSPEYEDCLQVARASGLPLKEVFRQVEKHFRHQFQP